MVPTPVWSHHPPRGTSLGAELQKPGVRSLKGRDCTLEERMEKGEVSAEIRLRHLMRANRNLFPGPYPGLERGQVKDPGPKASREDVCSAMSFIRGFATIMVVSNPLRNRAGNVGEDILRRFVKGKDPPLLMGPDHLAKEEKDHLKRKLNRVGRKKNRIGSQNLTRKI